MSPGEGGRSGRSRVRRVLTVLAWTLGVVVGLGALVVLLVANPVRPRGVHARVHIDPGALRRHVERLAADPGSRDWSDPEGLDRAAEYIRGELAAAGLEVSEQPFAVKGRTYRNVVARHGPTGAPLVVVGAHYDVCGEQPGADDNASAVAGLLELGRLLGFERPRLPHGVELVAYTLEEPPHFRSPDMGSAVHARSLRERAVRVRAMISLEMIGYFDDRPGSQRFPAPGLALVYGDRGSFVAVIGDTMSWSLTRQVKACMAGGRGLPVRSLNAPAFIPGVDFSDHQSYWNEGYPAVMVTDTAFYRNPHYREASDTPETLDYARLAEVVRGVWAVVTTL